MTEVSFPWSARNVGDGGPSAYTLDVVEDTNKFLSNIDPALAGVVYWTETPSGLLAPSNPSGSTVRIASGVGIVEGWLYTNDANIDTDINAAPGNANATDIMALRRDAAAQTVRLVRLNGAAGAKATLTQSAATWEIPLAEVALDGSGNFSALTDVRQLALPPASKVLLSRQRPTGATVTFSAIPPLFSHLRIEGRGRSTFAVTNITANLTFNQDTALNIYTYLAYERDLTPANTFNSSTGTTNIPMPNLTGASGTANYFDGFDILIPGYATVVGFQPVFVEWGSYETGTMITAMGSGWWKRVGVINRIDLTLITAWVAGSQVSLYGEV